MAARLLGIASRTIYRHLERQQPEQEGTTEAAEGAALSPPTSANTDKIE